MSIDDDAGTRPGATHRAICPGSFDPIHRGHVSVIERAARLFDEVIVAVADNPAKTYRFDLARRMELVRASVGESPRVVVVAMETGLIADFAAQHGACALVNGLRSGADFDYELPMAHMNAALSAVETVFMPTDPRYGHLSSSLIKQVHGLGAEIGDFVSPAVREAMDG